MIFEILSEDRHRFKAESTPVAFLTMMMLTRGLHGAQELATESPLAQKMGEEMLVKIPALHPNEANEWSKENLGEAYASLLFRHIHRETGRNALLYALDSVEPVGMARRVSGAFGMPTALVMEARDVAAAIRAIPLPYRTDEEAKEAQKAALEKEKDGKEQEKAAE